ncbi:uncharacterized protein J4E79_001820 [Alternaria viburni]|uniref:uncharacterized protein n=1 Tax=Alternaria viburni TaxID=566460 RepID=UPI0020C3A1EB|nr:uncharacterized protein J4E79_001820 [Alternaria viburni]KAI4667136.1 hypothetical protein J4E79_001820 [Alternaria viburni]
MWLRAYMVMQKRGREKENVAGEYKAVLELASTMREQTTGLVSEEGDEVLTVTEAKLRRRIEKDLRGGSISYAAPLVLQNKKTRQLDIRVWVESHKLSILAMIACILATLFSAISLPRNGIFLIPLPLELILALCIDRSIHDTPTTLSVFSE